MYLPSPLVAIIRLYFRVPHRLVSFIPTQHPASTHHTWISHSGKERAGLDHILIAAKHIDQASTCGIYHEIVAAYFTSDHYLMYVTFALSCPNTASAQHPTKLCHYRLVVQIPLIDTYPNKSNNFIPPWFTPQTLGILLNDVKAHETMHNELDVEHDNPQGKYHL